LTYEMPLRQLLPVLTFWSPAIPSSGRMILHQPSAG